MAREINFYGLGVRPKVFLKVLYDDRQNIRKMLLLFLTE